MEFNTRVMQKKWDQLTSEAFWDKVIDATIEITLILIASWLAVRLGKKFIKKVFLLTMIEYERGTFNG